MSTTKMPHGLMTPDEHGRLLYARTHAKALLGPIVVQVLMIVLHILSAMFLGRIIDFFSFLPQPVLDGLHTWAPWVVHGIIIIIELVYVIVPVLQWINARFIITEHSVMMSWGVFNRHTREIQIDRITQVEMERNVPDYLFGCGTIYLHEASSSDAVKLDDVPKVKEAKMILDQLIHHQR